HRLVFQAECSRGGASPRRHSHSSEQLTISSAQLVSRSTGASRFITAAGHVISGRRSDYYGADCFISAGRPIYHSVGDLLRISRWHPAETCCKTLVNKRLAQPDSKRPGAATPLFQELAWPQKVYRHALSTESRTYPVEGECHDSEPSAQVIATLCCRAAA